MDKPEYSTYAYEQYKEQFGQMVDNYLDNCYSDPVEFFTMLARYAAEQALSYHKEERDEAYKVNDCNSCARLKIAENEVKDIKRKISNLIQ